MTSERRLVYEREVSEENGNKRELCNVGEKINARMEFLRARAQLPEVVRARNNREYLIQQIVEQTDEKDKKKLAARIARFANAFKWHDEDLHYLLRKVDDPKIRNYTAFVKWSVTPHATT